MSQRKREPARLFVDADRIQARLQQLGQIGALEGGGVCRLALSDEDKRGRDLVTDWMRELRLEVTIDAIGNIVGIRPGRDRGPPIMTGSHIDTVRSGGLYDGTLGVIAGLEAIETLNDAAVETTRPLAVAVFTNEEGARFAPDMMGSLVHQGQHGLESALQSTDRDGRTVGAELQRIGYQGATPSGNQRASAYVELHIEQGPVLEHEGVDIGIVHTVQGISWTKVVIEGTSNHAGTTPMALRHDAGFAAGAITTFVRGLAERIGNAQVATVGTIEFRPNIVNVIPRYAELTVDLRNIDDAKLLAAEQELHKFLERITAKEGVAIDRTQLVRTKPVVFDADVVNLVERQAHTLGLSTLRMPSGAGHDAQAFAPNCPTAMIFVPSVGGVSHNIGEFTSAADIANGANVLLGALLQLSA